MFILFHLQMYNARQLEQWSLHFISNNYNFFKGHAQFSLLKDANLEYVKEHRKEEEKPMEKIKKKCSIM